MAPKHEFEHDVKLDVEARVRQGVKAVLEEVLQDEMTQHLVLRSSKVVHKRTPPMPRRFGWSPPYPRAGFAIQLPGGDSRG